jgi:pimeloyl-ACP methyl ester carboxylesterase
MMLGVILLVLAAMHRLERGRMKPKARRMADPLDKPLLHWSSADPFTLRDLLNGGVCITGRSGSGKTSSSGREISQAIVRERKSGGLILAAKPEDLAMWKEVFARESRSSDLLEFSPDAKLRFNFLGYVLAMGGQTRDVTRCITVIGETLRSADAKGGESADFWEKEQQRMIYNAVEIVKLATGSVSAPDIQRFITTAAMNPEQLASTQWRAGYCNQKLADAFEKQKSASQTHDFNLAADYWLGEFPAMAEKTRSSIMTGVMGILHVFNTGVVRDLVSTTTTVSPDVMLEGKWVLVNMAPAEWGDSGALIAAGWKYLVQRRVLRRKAKPGDGVVVSVDTVPQTADNARSLLGSLKLYFVKTALKQENVNSLRRVEVMPDGRVERQKFGVADAVAASSGVLLLVHGITGDTAEMAADVVASGIAAKFDLVLTYDYENLGTPIGDTALALEQALKGVGIAAGDGKSLTILAHSTGGLVSRCFIERGGGRDTVDHLVMCGTPNGGSPLGKAGAAMAVARLLGDFAANVAPASLPFLAPLRSVLKAAGGVTKSLEQINPASNFILELNASDDPGVRYTILAGSIDAYVAAGDGFAGRALVAAGRSAAFDLLFESQPNDIAVGVESIKTIGGVRAVKPVRHDVACHHLNYFASDAGRAALQAVAW